MSCEENPADTTNHRTEGKRSCSRARCWSCHTTCRDLLGDGRSDFLRNSCLNLALTDFQQRRSDPSLDRRPLVNGKALELLLKIHAIDCSLQFSIGQRSRLTLLRLRPHIQRCLRSLGCWNLGLSMPPLQALDTEVSKNIIHVDRMTHLPSTESIDQQRREFVGEVLFPLCLVKLCVLNRGNSHLHREKAIPNIALFPQHRSVGF